MKKIFFPLSLLSLISLLPVAHAARGDKNKNYNDMCTPEPGAVCYPDDAPCAMCLGPSNTAINAAVRPHTCNGDIFITVAGFYWNARQDCMEYAVRNEVDYPAPPTLVPIQQLNNLTDAKYQTPKSKWDFGFKIGLGYNSACDGWDIGILWTWYRGGASSHIQALPDDNNVLIPLWSAYSPAFGSVLYAEDITARWKLNLNLVDIELGREFWVSRYLTVRPHMGLRIAFIKQDYDIDYRGGAWLQFAPTFRGEVDLKNDFKGAGLRGGLDTVWNFGRGWGLYGNFAGSIVYGRFTLENDEATYTAVAPVLKTKILETEDHFRASRGMLDLALGVQFQSMFCDCKYLFIAMLGWEHHLLFNQNQWFRVNRIDDGVDPDVPPNNLGENVFIPSHGDLSTQGWTLTLRFEF